MRHEARILRTALASGFPAVAALLILLWTGNYSDKLRWTLALLAVGCWWGFAIAVRDRVASPLRTLANLLEAMREGDYSIRARGARGEDALAEVMQQANAMGATLREQRLGALEATALLRKVMEEINVAVFAFDQEQRLRLVNRAGERLVANAAERVLGLRAEELDLADCLEGEFPRTMQRRFAGGAGRWGIARASFREGGLPHQLLVVTDLTRPLREEELQAWQRIVRVLGHELNNSLAPIKSIAGSLESMLHREELPADWREDMMRGLGIVSARSEALSRFMGAYARLAKLPRPQFAPVNAGDWIRGVVALETRKAIEVAAGPHVVVQGDKDQLEQLLINLMRNAVDATMENGGVVAVRWEKQGPNLHVVIEDTGPGIANTANLFVPFFTTKPGGSGIGLVLSRQMAEAHGGTIELRNRSGGGCEARLTLPV
ncbi:MAG: PAS domain-containing sensor histidine kinase [Candidatus Solibacter usitatus]|nr:PAS domain-containing sensor histidine kinase [Candidatus Solibacter usitatus]